MTVTDQIRILDKNIMQNEAQYDLDRKVAKTSALSSNYLGQSEYLTGEDLGFKPSTFEQAKYEYSLLGKIFTKGLEKEEDKKQGLLKRLKNIEDKNEWQLKILKDQAEKQRIIIKVKTPNFNNVSFKTSLDGDWINVFDGINEIDLSVDHSNLTFFGSSKKYNFDFKSFISLGSITENIYNDNVSLNTAK